MNIRQLLSKKPDSALVAAVKEDIVMGEAVDERLRSEVGLDEALATEYSLAREVATVAKAIGRNRLAEGGHQRLSRREEMQPEPKRASRRQGELVRERRGIER